MQYTLLRTLDYPKSASITLEQARLYHKTPVVHNFLSSTMNSGFMTVHHNDPEIVIDDPEDFCKFRS